MDALYHLGSPLVGELTAGPRVVGVGPSVLTLVVVLLGVEGGYGRPLASSGAKAV